jgi:hypothetical protein
LLRIADLPTPKSDLKVVGTRSNFREPIILKRQLPPDKNSLAEKCPLIA